MISIGKVLDGKYLVTRRLGGGGFGEVFLAKDEAIPGRHVAIKVLTSPSDEQHSDLLWEMQKLAQLNHPHVVSFYHHFKDRDQLCLVMEFCSGGSLSDRLRTAKRFPESQVFAWALQLCETLRFVHEQGTVHHDIKPQNILFAGDESIKIGDFGVANRSIGTRMYLPPEFLLGECASRNDPRIDVYALGLTLLELVVGRHPFQDFDQKDALRARIRHDFVPSQLSRWVQEVLLRATHPAPELRFQSAADFGEAIRSRHIPYIFDGTRIRADAIAKQAGAAIARRKWRTAERLASQAIDLSPDCVSALLAAGRCQLLIRNVDQAGEYLNRALSISPRTPVQKELALIKIEQNRLPEAISSLTDHLQRNPSDYEAYNLLLKCFYLTDRLEAAESLARTLIGEKAPSRCFYSNLLLCLLLKPNASQEEIQQIRSRESYNSFVFYNYMVATESPPSWNRDREPFLKSKMLFQEYRHQSFYFPKKKNTLAIYYPSGTRYEIDRPIVPIGSLEANGIMLDDKSVSRRHCVIVNYPEDVWLYDLNSTLGTTIDGRRIEGRVILDGVHEIGIGSVPIRVASNSELLI